MKKILSILCAVLFILGIAANIHYAVEGYGMKKNNLNLSVFAQGTGSDPEEECSKLVVPAEHSKTSKKSDYWCIKSYGIYEAQLQTCVTVLDHTFYCNEIKCKTAVNCSTGRK